MDTNTTSTTDLPKVGAEVLVDICPDNWPGESWMQMGKILALWRGTEKGEPHIWAVIELTRVVTAEDCDDWNDYSSDDDWNGCLFVCRLNACINDWLAIWPASFH